MTINPSEPTGSIKKLIELLNEQTPVLINQGKPFIIRTKYLPPTKCYIERGVYPATGQPYLRLIDARRGVLMTASVAVEGYTLEPDHCFIKAWSENQGILEALEHAGVVSRTGESYLQGFVEIPVVKILMA